MKQFLKAAALTLSATTVLLQPAAAKTDALTQQLTEPAIRVSFAPQLNIADRMVETSATERAPLVQFADSRKPSRRMRTRTVRRSIAKPRRIKKQMTSAHKRRRNGTTSKTNGDPTVDVQFDFSP